MSAGVPRGRFVWHDLMTTDVDAAKSFYQQILGWTIAQWDGPMEYSMWTNAGEQIGGVMALPEDARNAGAPPHWIAYVAVEDVDATAAKTKELGGSVLVQPEDIPEVGRFAVLQDPQGAMIAVYSAADRWTGHDGPSKVGEFSWHELATTDWQKAFDFYHELFGWEKTSDVDMGPMGTYQMYGRAGSAGDPNKSLGGMFDKPADMPGPPAWILYAQVPDVHQAAEKVKAQGGQVVNGPMEVPGGDWIVQCSDPQGAFFALHHRAQQS